MKTIHAILKPRTSDELWAALEEACSGIVSVRVSPSMVRWELYDGDLMVCYSQSEEEIRDLAETLKQIKREGL